jgi:hypothetical protein
MSNDSKYFREIAGQHLRKAREATTWVDKDHHEFLARSYKRLAHDEERLSGEPEKSRTTPRASAGAASK